MIGFRVGAVLAALLAGASTHAALNPFEGPRPIAVFIEQNPWLMVVGSDVPRVAIYENGDVIFLKKSGKDYSLHIAHLSSPELARLEATWAPLFTAKLKSNYALSDATDQTSAEFFFQRGNRQVAVSAYGLNCNENASERKLSRDAALPPALLQVHNAFCNLDFKRSQTWSPKYVEVMLWDYSYAPDKSIYWPRGWPDLTSKRAVKRGDSWSLFLDGSYLTKLEAFLKTGREKGAVVVDRKKWAASYRFTFPSEPVWRKALTPRQDKE